MKKKIKIVLLILLSVIASIFVIEVFLRMNPQLFASKYQSIGWNHWRSPTDVERYGRFQELYNSMYVYDEKVGYIKSEIVEEIKEKSASHGEKKYSILVLGDSVSEMGQYVQKLEDTLDKEYGENSIEIINAGVVGYDTRMEELFLRKYGAQYQPDLVILQFNVNDFDGTPVFIKNSDNSWLAFDSHQNIGHIYPQLFDNSKLYQFLVLSYLQYTKTASPANSQTVKKPLEDMSHYLKEAQTDLVVVYFPMFENSEEKEKRHSLFTQTINEVGLEKQTLDLTSAFESFSLPDISLDPTHPNERGDEIASQEIFSFLKPLLDSSVFSPGKFAIGSTEVSAQQ